MVPNYLSVSGVDPNEGATTVYVWRRDQAAKEGRVLLSTAPLVPAEQAARLPGIQPGEFRVTFPAPAGCSVRDILVTDDLKKEEPLPNVTVVPCGASAVSARPDGKKSGASGFFFLRR